MASSGDQQAPKRTASDASLGISQESGLPQKKFYRSRAHCNPLSHNDAFAYPRDPESMDWGSFYPELLGGARGQAPGRPLVELVDVGCGFGGLSIALAELYPTRLTLGMEIRAKVTEYVRLRIEALRQKAVDAAAASASASAPAPASASSTSADAAPPHHYNNVAVMKTNAMKYLPNFFRRAQLWKLFFCFPDPHFKAKNHRRRIVNTQLLAEYAYALRPGGMLYTITDVRELYEWHVSRCEEHPLFERVPQAELDKDPAVAAIISSTEEAKKVSRSGGHNTEGKKFVAVFRRVEQQQAGQASWTPAASSEFWSSSAATPNPLAAGCAADGNDDAAAKDTAASTKAE